MIGTRFSRQATPRIIERSDIKKKRIVFGDAIKDIAMPSFD